MTPHQLAKVVVGGGEGDQREVWRVRGRLSPREPPRPRRGILRDPSSPGGDPPPPAARGSRGSWGRRVPVPVQHLPNFPSPRPRSHPYLYPTRRAAAPTCAAAATARDGSGSPRAAGRRGGGAAGGVSGEAPAPWAETGRARGSRGGGGAPSSWRAWGPDPSEARAPLPGTALGPSPGRLRGALSLRATPAPSGVGAGGGERGPRSYLLVACSFSGFPRGGSRLSWVFGLTRGQEVAKSWNARL